jgi:hypothetical protein
MRGGVKYFKFQVILGSGNKLIADSGGKADKADFIG